MLFEKRIKEKRLEKDLTQEQLGDLIGVTKSSVSNWEKGLKKPSTKNLISLSKVLNANMEYLVANDSYVVSNDDENYGIMMASEEINIIKELRKHEQLYHKILENPKRSFDRIEKTLF